MNSDDAILLLLELSVKRFAFTLTVTAPSAIGVRSTLYSVEDTELKPLTLAPLTVISDKSRSVVASEVIRVKISLRSLVTRPSATGSPSAFLAVIAIVGLSPS